ncbi:hypothetical protein NDU88_004113 [Pleurodeles waltl]|uniref:Uncharacterized protein n=1 Tax=Pleurodeles waltl TaxID=8319 RepID=A0AAV7SHU1_PLEWA|nr:hypothetical protein NDU88_004113 [Pleurodeles waltl]
MKGARPKEWSLPRLRGRRRQRGEGDRLWGLPRRKAGGADSSDSEGTRSMSIRKRDRREDIDSVTPESRLGADRDSPHPLLEVINSLETDKEALGANETGEAAL